ncbi:hypothetical protein [Dyella terrae]|nr:hypothetical protein [Dyella terrae]
MPMTAKGHPPMHGKVLAVSQRPRADAAASVWVRITLAIGRDSIDLFMPYATQNETYPSVGQSCDADVEVGDVRGELDGVASFERNGVLIVRGLRCA